MIQKKSLKEAIQNPEIISVVGGLLPEANISSKGLMSPLQSNINSIIDIKNLTDDNYYKILSISNSDILSVKFLVARGNSIVYYSLFAYFGGNGLVTSVVKTGNDYSVDLEFYYAKNVDRYDFIYRRKSNHSGVFKIECTNKINELYNEKLLEKPSDAVLIPII